MDAKYTFTLLYFTLFFTSIFYISSYEKSLTIAFLFQLPASAYKTLPFFLEESI